MILNTSMIQLENYPDGFLRQGDILRNVQVIEATRDIGDDVEIDFIEFPYALVLSQACDLLQDYRTRNKILKYEQDPVGSRPDNDKFLFSVLILPIYNASLFREGLHLQKLGLKMNSGFPSQKKWRKSHYVNNEIPRYHHIDFDPVTQLVESILDFKHYFTCSIPYLSASRATKYIGTLDVLYRAQISQRFAHYLCRIGLDDEQDEIDEKTDES